MSRAVSSKKHHCEAPPSGVRLATVAAVAAVAGWVWAVLLIGSREHLVGFYKVISLVPPGWGIFVAPMATLVFAAVGGSAWMWACGRAGWTDARVISPCAGRLMLAYGIPLLDFARMAGLPVPLTFLEPIFLAAITYAAVAALPREGLASVTNWRWGRRSLAGHGTWFAMVCLVSLLAGLWWYFQARQWYDDFLLGFNDFGQFTLRIANTWAGRGWLMEAPCLPAFWDHFNPGLLLLVPLWGLWPSAHLVFAIQAFCLVSPALLIFPIGRHLGMSRSESAMWSLAWLVYPVVGQLNLNYTYGWHPVSLALPLLFWMLWMLLAGRYILATLAALLACSFKENVIVILALFSLAMAGQSWWVGRTTRRGGVPCASSRLSGRLPAWGWMAVALVLVATFVLVYQLAPFRHFQVGRFGRLGATPLQIVMSPVLNPTAFWGTVFRARSAYFLLVLTVPLGLSCLYRGRWLLLPLVLPVLVLLAWDHMPATSIAFQYHTTLIPFLLVAAMTGSIVPEPSTRDSATDGQGAQRPVPPSWSAAAALVAAATASVALGALPWSSSTLATIRVGTYLDESANPAMRGRPVGSPGNQRLRRIIRQARRDHVRVLATGRLAAHLIGVPRLETVTQALDSQRWWAMCEEAGEDRSPLTLFDRLLLDTREVFQQQPREIERVLSEAPEAGFVLESSEHGILVLRRER